MLHSQKAGTLQKIIIDEDFRKNNIVESEIYYKPGDKIEAFTGSYGTLGTMILKFSSRDEMLEKMEHMEKWIQVITE